MNGAAGRPLVGLFGAFDTGELGEVALRRVLETELARRRPDIDLVSLAPFGAERPVPGDEGRPARPLSGAAPLDLDALVIAGDVLDNDRQWAARYPSDLEEIAERGVVDLVLAGTRSGRPAAPSVLWFAVGSAGGLADTARLSGRDVWARDQATQSRLGGTAVQSGDPLLLAGRAFSAEVLGRRADLLRLCGALPAGQRLVVEVSPGLAASAGAGRLLEAVSASLRRDPRLLIVVLNLNPARQGPDPTFRVPDLLAERVHHLPTWVGLDDIAAAMSGSGTAVVATTPAGAHLAASLGSRVSAIDTGLGDRFDPAIPMLSGDLTAPVHALLGEGNSVAIDGAVGTLDGALAELAERLPHSPVSARRGDRPDPVEPALAILQRRLVDERTALQAELSRVQSELDHLRASPEHRIARPIREAYRRWQRRRT